MDADRNLAHATRVPADQREMLRAVGGRGERDRAELTMTAGKLGDGSDLERGDAMVGIAASANDAGAGRHWALLLSAPLDAARCPDVATRIRITLTRRCAQCPGGVPI